MLRKDLGFQGIISTDALDMAGITKQWPAGQAAVRAIQAGVDVLLMPANPEEAITAVVSAVRRGEISRERIDQSVRKILGAKARLGLDRRRMVNLETMLDELDLPEDIQKAQEVADRAVTLVRNERALVPLGLTSRVCFLVLTESRGSQEGRAFASEVRTRMPNAPVVILDPSASTADLDQAVQNAQACDAVIVAAFAPVAAYRGSVALAGGLPDCLNRVIAGRQAGGPRGAGKSLSAERIPRRGGLSHYLQHGAAFRDCRGEGAVRRQFPFRAASGDHSRPRQLRRRDPDGGHGGPVIAEPEEWPRRPGSH